MSVEQYAQDMGNAQCLANNILTALTKHYPAWASGWSLRIDTDGGIIQVTNHHITGKMGFQCPITNVDPEMRTVVYMAGELLERYRMSREKNTKLQDQKGDLRKSPVGEAIYDD